ncbi:MAG TPA: type 1 glutamine amidotransferase domain-containing protein [Opitutaceae bacterium]|nr:type 1 glutamine amidotransferase domain-containing protein [Opitutaceae bacterium]
MAATVHSAGDLFHLQSPTADTPSRSAEPIGVPSPQTTKDLSSMGPLAGPETRLVECPSSCRIRASSFVRPVTAPRGQRAFSVVSTNNERHIMNQNRLNGKKVAILATEGFEQPELEKPREALDQAGATTEIISPKSGQIRAWDKTDWGDTFDVDKALSAANPDDYDALMLPGGVLNPDKLRQDPAAVKFVQAFFEAGKPVAAICHGPQMLIEADVVRGRKMTSYNSVKRDLMNAGANWVDEPVVVDCGLVTSRKPDDIPQFNAKMIEEFAEGEHPRIRESAGHMSARR